MSFPLFSAKGKVSWSSVGSEPSPVHVPGAFTVSCLHGWFLKKKLEAIKAVQISFCLCFLQQVCVFFHFFEKKAPLLDPLINALSRQTCFLADGVCEWHRFPAEADRGKRSQLSLCRANQTGYLTAYALLWPTPAEGWRLHHSPWTPPWEGCYSQLTTQPGTFKTRKIKLSSSSNNLNLCFFCLSDMKPCLFLQHLGGSESCYSSIACLHFSVCLSLWQHHRKNIVPAMMKLG